jgi:hypothetical protein
LDFRADFVAFRGQAITLQCNFEKAEHKFLAQTVKKTA